MTEQKQDLMMKNEPKDLKIVVEFVFGDKVEFNNKVEKDEGTIISIHVEPGLNILYSVRWSNKSESTHYGFELKAIKQQS